MSSVMAERRLQRKKMVDNKIRLLNFFLSSGRDFLQEVLEVYASPGLLFGKLGRSTYFSDLSHAEQESLFSLKRENTFSDLELDQLFELLRRFTYIRQPACLWCGQCYSADFDSEHVGENIEKLMSIWNVVNKTNSIPSEQYEEYVRTLTNIGHNVSTLFASGKSFRDSVRQELGKIDTFTDNLQIVTYEKDVSMQFGHNNKCILNVEVFDHLENDHSENDTESNNSDADDLVKMILHMEAPSSSGLYIARIEESVLKSLSGQKLESVNAVLKDKFGVEIVVHRKGCIVLVLRKSMPFSKNLLDAKILEQFLITLFGYAGLSTEELSVMTFRMDVTKGDSEDADRMKYQSTARDIEVMLFPANTVQSLSTERKKELVSFIVTETADQNLRDAGEELQIQADFISTKGAVTYKRGNENIASNQTVRSSKENESTKARGIENVQIENALGNNPLSMQMIDNSNSTQPLCHIYDEVSRNIKNSPTAKISNKSIENLSNQDHAHHFWNDSNHRPKRTCRVALLTFCIVFLGSSLLALCLIMVPRTNSEFKLKPCDNIHSHTYMNPPAERMVIRTINGSIRESLKNYKNVVHLDLSFNRISFMNFSTLCEFSTLRYLSLSNNFIQRTDGIERIPDLQELDISSNLLQGIDELHKHSKSHVRFLNISGNRIFRLQLTDFSNFPHLQFLDISNNPIQKPIIVQSVPCLLDSICRIQINSLTILIDCAHVVSMLPTQTKSTRTQITSTKETSPVNLRTNYRITIQIRGTLQSVSTTLRRILDSLSSTTFPISTFL